MVVGIVGSAGYPSWMQVSISRNCQRAKFGTITPPGVEQV